MEISPIMVNRCQKKLSEKHLSKIKKKDIQFECQSILDYKKYDKDLTFLVMLELLDNMPHDRVYIVSEKK